MLDSSHVKAKFRLTRSLLFLNRISECREIAFQLQEEVGLKFGKLLHEINQAYDEHFCGNHNLPQMFKEASTTCVTSFHANFTSTKMERGVTCTKQSGFSYRGCVALDSIPKKTLLSASKAFVVIPPSKRTEATFAVNPYKNVFANHSQIQIVNKAIVLLHRRPQLKRIFYSLASGYQEE